MLEKNNRDEQSVAARVTGNAPRAALLSGVAVIVIGLALVVAFLMLVREPAQQTELLNQTTAGYAAQRARLVEHTVDSLRTRIKAAAVSPVVQELIGAQAGDQAAGQEAGVDLGQIETAMQSYFPEALSLRLVPLRELGTADLDAEVLGLRNHIEVDLVRRANNGEEPEPEAYQVEGAWIASLATIATNPEIESRRAVVLLSLDQTTLESWLTQGKDTAGRFVLEQRLDRRGVKRQQAVVSQGTGTAPHIFRAYDIRGVADTELDDETVYRIGSAIGTIAGEMGEQTLVIGYDGRASSSRIKAVLEKALLQAGRDVIDIGLVPTPLLYFATHHLDAGSGVMVTGSHNPPQYNGMKIVLKRQSIAHGTIEKIRNLAHTGRFSKGTGHLIQKDVVSGLP
jgi:hypothetical protein